MSTNTLVMNSLNLGLSPKTGNSEFIAMSQKSISDTSTESINNELPELPDTSSLESDKSYQLKWNNSTKKFEWSEIEG